MFASNLDLERAQICKAARIQVVEVFCGSVALLSFV